MPTINGDLVVTGSVIASENEVAGNKVSALMDIGAGNTITAVNDVSAGNNVEAGNIVSAILDVGAGRDIVAQHNVVAGNDVVAFKNVQFFNQAQPLTPPPFDFPYKPSGTVRRRIPGRQDERKHEMPVGLSVGVSRFLNPMEGTAWECTIRTFPIGCKTR